LLGFSSIKYVIVTSSEVWDSWVRWHQPSPGGQNSLIASPR